MNDLQRRLAELTDGQRWRLLTWIAREHLQVVTRALSRAPRDPGRTTVVPGEVTESYYHLRVPQEPAAPGGDS